MTEEYQELLEQGLLSRRVVAQELAFLQQLALEEPEALPAETPALGVDHFATGAALPPTAPVDLRVSVPLSGGQRLAPGVLLCQRYRVVALVGRGGMGQIYLVYDQRRKRYIAIKCLRPLPQLTPAQMEKQLEAELDTNELLTHPHILRTYSLELEPSLGFSFFTMEYVAGGTLQEWLDQGVGLPERFGLSLALLQQIARALDYAHDKGIIHRDLKPANVLLSLPFARLEEGQPPEVKLLDFGIATDADGAVMSPSLGTAYYMAPEQLRGESLSVRADLYSLGVMAFQMLTGHLPQPGMPGPSVINPALSAALDPVLAKAMHWQPTQRFETAGAFVHALQKADTQTSEAPKRAQAPGELVELRHRRSSYRSHKHTTTRSQATEAAGAAAQPEGTAQAAGPEAREATETPKAERGGLIALSQERDELFARLQERIDKKRPRWLEAVVPKCPPRSVPLSSPLVPTREEWMLPPLPPAPADLKRRLLLSRKGLPLLEFVLVPPGHFWMGLPSGVAGARPQETPKRQVKLDGFWIARTPVTNRIWSIFLEESGYTPGPEERGTYYLRHWRQEQPPAEALDAPVVWLSYTVAWAFCDFYGLSLPSEAQWEKAARGADERLYPWGHEAPNPTFCNYRDVLGGVSRVGQFELDHSPFGVLDMAGNITEWCADSWSRQVLEGLPEIGAEDPASPPTSRSSRVVVRGGHYHHKASFLRATCRQGLPLGQSAAHTGFRPVMDWRK